MDDYFNNKAVFLITIDALRPDHLKSYGYYRNTAPNLENFVDQGVTFLNAIANGPDSPSSFSAIFTSILPFLEGGYSPIPLQKLTFPQLLEENKIFTFAIHSNPHLGKYFNYDRGFNIFLDGERYKTKLDKPKKTTVKHLIRIYLKKVLNYKNLIKNFSYRILGFNKIKIWLRKKVPYITEILLPFMPIAYNAPYIVNKVMKFISKFRGSLFLWAHFMDIHSPYVPPTECILKFLKSGISQSQRELINKIINNPQNFNINHDIVEKVKVLYDAQICFLDSILIALFNFINLRFKKNCLIIITADHGEEFYEHGSFHHQGSIFDELLKIPLFIIETGKNPKVKRIKEIVQSIDIPPTILDYFGIDIPDNFQGKSLLTIIEGNLINREKFIISEGYQKDGKIKRNSKEGFVLLSIRRNEWKYIFDEENNKEYLFNLKIDPYEKKNLIDENPKQLDNEFRKIKAEHLQKAITSSETSKIVKGIKSLDLSKI